MKLIMELMELALYDIVQIATVALELFGIAVLVFTAVKCFILLAEEGSENILPGTGPGNCPGAGV